MPRASSLDFRERAVRVLDVGHPAPEVADLFGVSEHNLFRWQGQRRMGGSLAPRTSPDQAPKIDPVQHAALRAQVAAHADATLAQHCALWLAATGVRVGIATLARTFTALGITLKEKSGTRRNAIRTPGPRGGRRLRGGIRGNWSSSMRPAPRWT